MPSVTYDGRSFLVDGRRLWIVSGSLHYTRIPREQWEERIHMARYAGLNTVDVPVFWNRHEPRPGHFDFTGDNDLRHFIQLIGQAGMHCILRPGPYIGEDWDFGGFPVWLTSLKDSRLRAASGPFLEACSRYLSAVAERVRDLQVTSRGSAGPGGVGGGPILLVQNEAQWTCGDDREADAYLGELNRYLREAGFTVPIINANNLWQGPEGEIECWSGSGDLLSTVRQLAAVRPDKPRLVVDFDIAHQPVFGEPLPPAASPAALQQQLAQILAGAAQFNIRPFHGGTNFGFWGGRSPDLASSGGGFATASRSHGAPLNEAGAPGPTFPAVRRLCTFASRFGRIFANLAVDYRPVVAAPHTGSARTAAAAPATVARHRSSAADARDLLPPTVLHATGPQGSVAFVFSAPASTDEQPPTVDLLLPDGTLLPVEIGAEGVTWCVFDAFLGGRAKLDYCNLSAFAALGKVLIIFGRPGATARLSINGAPMDAVVPAPRSGPGTPTIVSHEGCTVVIATPAQLDAIALTDDAVYVGCAGLTTAQQPIAMPGAKSCIRINAEGQSANVPAAPAPKHPRHTDRLSFAEWTFAATADYCDGTSARFAAIDGPADLGALGCAYGYGWYRCRLPSAPARKAHLMAPAAGDRLHLYSDGSFAGILGRGPGAAAELALQLRKAGQTLVLLADNMGRLAGGTELGELKGLYGHLWDVAPLKLPKPAIKPDEPIDILGFKSPLWGIQTGDRTLPDRLTWTLNHRKKHPVLLTLGAMPGRALLLINNAPLAFVDRGPGRQILIPADRLKSGSNTVQLAMVPDDQDIVEASIAAATDSARFFEAAAAATDGADWAFARWEPPRASAFQKAKANTRNHGPSWWKSHFRPVDAHAPLYLDLAGMTKGQIYVNGRHLGRYFVATHDGKPVPPRTTTMIPSCWLRAGEDNELLLFDEHGGSPAKVQILYEPAHA